MKNPYVKVLVFTAFLGLVWFTIGMMKSHYLNKESLVVIGKVYYCDNNLVKYKFNYLGIEYFGNYSYYEHTHAKREEGDKLYVRFNPSRPEFTSLAIRKGFDDEIPMKDGAILDSLNTKKIEWWEYQGNIFPSLLK